MQFAEGQFQCLNVLIQDQFTGFVNYFRNVLISLAIHFLVGLDYECNGYALPRSIVSVLILDPGFTRRGP